MARWFPRVWVALLALATLGPALGHGYVLTYDMVWVPDLTLRSDFWGLGSAVPRAVPSDAVVALLDEVVPGMLLQKAVLLGALVGAGLGACRLGPRSLVGQCVAATVYLWNPYVFERLVMGHWPVLIGYAVLPWILTVRPAVTEGSRGGRWLPAPLYLLVPLGSLAASVGILTAVATFARHGRSAPWRVLLLVAAANAPWVVAGALNAGAARISTVGDFALSGEGHLPALLAALGLGGIWNDAAVPPSRLGVTAVVGLLVLVVGVVAGAQPWWRSDRALASASLVCWVVGFLVTASTVVSPGLVEWLAEHVPGGGVLRDGSRALGLCAPLLAGVLSAAAHRAVHGIKAPEARGGLSLALLLLPVALMPDQFAGLSGRLDAVDYPESYALARDQWQGAGGSSAADVQGDLLLLPLGGYRAPEWNDRRTVIDPVGRYLPVNYVADDRLVIDRGGRSQVLAGEDPRVPQVLAALSLPDPAQRSAALAEAGIGLVTWDSTAGLAARVDLAGRLVVDTPDLDVVALTPSATPRATSWWRTLLVGASWLCFLGMVVVSVTTGSARRRDLRRSGSDGSARRMTQ